MDAPVFGQRVRGRGKCNFLYAPVTLLIDNLWALNYVPCHLSPFLQMHVQHLWHGCNCFLSFVTSTLQLIHIIILYIGNESFRLALQEAFSAC